jgi:hypothetical protein
MLMTTDELEVAIAEAKGWTFNAACQYWRNENNGMECDGLTWATDICTAWMLVEEMADQGDLFIESWQDGEWFIANHPISARPRGLASCDGKTTGKRDICLAICRAWLAWNDGKNRYDMGG